MTGVKRPPTAISEYPFDARLEALQSPGSGPQAKDIAFTSLIEQYRPWMFRAAYKYSLSRESAEDAVQEASIKAWGTIHSFEPTGPKHLAHWLSRIATLSAINTCRVEAYRDKRHVRFLADDTEADVLEILPAPRPGPATIVLI